MVLQGITGQSVEGVQSGLGYKPFFVTDPFNYSLLFPTESQFLSQVFHSAGWAADRSEYLVGKESVWALHCRIRLLWNSCLRMRYGFLPGHTILECTA
jgi:hypothetical protein